MSSPMPRGEGETTLRGEMDADVPLCRLEQMEGREVPCPKEGCAFWEPGTAAVEGWCVLHGIDFAQEPGLAQWLLELRKAVDSRPDK